MNTFGVQELGEAELLLGDVEGVVQVVYGVGAVQPLELDEVGPVLVDDGVEGQAVAPRGGEVAHVHVVVAGGLHLAPEEQRVLRGLGLLVVGLLDGDVLDL